MSDSLPVEISVASYPQLSSRAHAAVREMTTDTAAPLKAWIDGLRSATKTALRSAHKAERKKLDDMKRDLSLLNAIWEMRFVYEIEPAYKKIPEGGNILPANRKSELRELYKDVSEDDLREIAETEDVTPTAIREFKWDEEERMEEMREAVIDKTVEGALDEDVWAQFDAETGDDGEALESGGWEAYFSDVNVISVAGKEYRASPDEEVADGYAFALETMTKRKELL